MAKPYSHTGSKETPKKDKTLLFAVRENNRLQSEIESLKRDRALLVDKVQGAMLKAFEYGGKDYRSCLNQEITDLLTAISEPQATQWLTKHDAEVREGLFSPEDVAELMDLASNSAHIEALEEAASIFEEEDEHLRIEGHVHTFAERLRRLAASKRKEQFYPLKCDSARTITHCEANLVLPGKD